MDLNNRRTGKHATKHRAMGLLGHSVHASYISTDYVDMQDNYVNVQDRNFKKWKSFQQCILCTQVTFLCKMQQLYQHAKYLCQHAR